MFKHVLHTISSRLINLILNGVLLLITTRLLGAEVKGEISLFVLNISFVVLGSGFIGGSSLVYLVPRLNKTSLYFLSYLWSICIAALGTLAVYAADLLNELSPLAFFVSAAMESLLVVNLMVILGEKKIQWHNGLQVGKVALTVAILSLLIWLGSRVFESFYQAFIISQVLVLGVSIIVCFRSLGKISLSGLLGDFRQLLKFGSLIQLGNLAQLVNYRLSYYYLEWIVPDKKLSLLYIGVYSAAVQIAEAMLLVARSVSVVQYASISNQDDRKASLDLSVKLIKFNYSITGLMALVVLVIPESLFTLVLGEEFRVVGKLVKIMSVGIVFASVSNGISHFYAGIGAYHYNTIASLFGLLLTVILCYWAIAVLGLSGAALSSIIVYFLQTSLQVYFLKKTDNVRMKDLIFTRQDFAEVVSKLKF